MRHLLVTNDFPPKVGGIQTYLWELWRRLPPDDVCVITSSHPDARTWDATQPYRIERMPGRVLVPGRSLLRRIHRLAAETGARSVVLDPVLHLAPLARRLDLPYAVVVHGAELVIPSYTPVAQLAVRDVLRGAQVVIAAGDYPAAAARQAAGGPVPTVVVPPGVDTARFTPLDAAERAAARERHGFDPGAPLVVSLSRLVPRKGMDVLIQATARLAARHEGLSLAIAGTGRDRERLEKLAGTLAAPVQFLGKVPDEQLREVYGMADVFAMLCRDRWGGLEQEGFGIVFLEAASTGVPQVAGRSGGSGEAVVHGETGFVVDDPKDVDAAAEALGRLLDDPMTASLMGAAARDRAVASFDHELLAGILHASIQAAAHQSLTDVGR